MEVIDLFLVIHCKSIFRYDPGGGASVLFFIQKVPRLFDESDRMNVAVEMLKLLEPEIPIFHTRAMRKKFNKEVKLLNSATPSYLIRHVYRTLTGDASAEVTKSEIDDRVKLAIETEDPDLIIDLRNLNAGRPADTFNEFFNELEKIVEEITAADERRHGVAHMSEFLSIQDLIKQVKERLPEDAKIPSESTVIHSFAPPNLHKKTSQYYTGRINLKHTIQRRQLRAYHSDAHWCSALYRYMREMAILSRQNSVFISCDDKAKVDFGEPGSAVSTGVRGKRSIVPSTSILGALDHDVNQKGIKSSFDIG